MLSGDAVLVERCSSAPEYQLTPTFVDCRLQSECREARERADAQTAVARTAAAQLAQSEAAVERADKKVDELKGQLSDRDSELAAAQRKLVAARESASAADADATRLASQASLGVPGTPRGAANPLSRGAGSFNDHAPGTAATAAVGTPMLTDMQREIDGLKEALAARTAELDAEKEVVLKLRREAAGGGGGGLRSKAPDEAAERDSAASRAQAAEVARLSELAAARDGEVARLRQSAAALEAQAQHAAVLDLATRRQQQQLEEYRGRILDLEAQLRDADALRDRLQRQVGSCRFHQGGGDAVGASRVCQGRLMKWLLSRIRMTAELLSPFQLKALGVQVHIQ